MNGTQRRLILPLEAYYEDCITCTLPISPHSRSVLALFWVNLAQFGLHDQTARLWIRERSFECLLNPRMFKSQVFHKGTKPARLQKLVSRSKM